MLQLALEFMSMCSLQSARMHAQCMSKYAQFMAIGAYSPLRFHLRVVIVWCRYLFLYFQGQRQSREVHEGDCRENSHTRETADPDTGIRLGVNSGRGKAGIFFNIETGRGTPHPCMRPKKDGTVETPVSATNSGGPILLQMMGICKSWHPRTDQTRPSIGRPLRSPKDGSQRATGPPAEGYKSAYLTQIRPLLMQNPGRCYAIAVCNHAHQRECRQVKVFAKGGICNR